LRARTELVLVLAVGAAGLAVFHGIFGGFFPSANGRIGHDYGYFFPQLLTGYYWYHQNGPLAVPWFTPALGGGLPYYPNPASLYYSLPQLLALCVDPLAAVRANLMIFAALGFAGAYLMLRRALGLGPWSALTGAVLFLFNGYYPARMLVGHLAFHSIMLVPWIAWLLVRPLPAERPLRRGLVDALAAGVLLAYMFQSANFYGIPDAVGAALALALIASLRRPGELGGLSAVPRLVGAGLVALALSSSKLSAAAAFMDSVARTDYPLPGFEDLGTALAVLARALFWYAPADAAESAMTNTKYQLARHEFELGVTPATAALIALGLLFALGRRLRARCGWPWRAVLPKVALLCLLLAIPLAVNVHEPRWNAFLKSLPLLSSASNLLRNLAVYVPVAVACGALGLEALPARARPVLAAAAMLGALFFVSQDDRSLYAGEIYDPRPVVAAWREVHAGAAPPPVTTMVAPFDQHGRPHTPIDRNDALVRGESQLICYEPIFGYQLEALFQLPMPALGPAELQGELGYNARNPALFVFPAENGGRPGEPFRSDQLAELRLFLAYRPFAFERSARQELMDALNLLALAAVAAALAGYPLWRAPRRAGRAT
jgi:hypothetical protein